MQKFSFVVASIGLLSNPAVAMSPRATIDLVAVIPVSCSIDFVGGSIAGDRLTVEFRRTCNTGHRLTFSGATDGIDAVSMRFNGEALDLGQGSATLPQAERYYEGIDRLTVTAEGATEQQLHDLAASLSIDLETA